MQNRREQRGRSNLGGAPAPPPPWRPSTRGRTLLPSRGEAKEEEEGGGSLPLTSGGAVVPPGQRPGRRSTSTIFLPSTPTFSPSIQWCNTSSPCCNLYLNMVLNSIYYFPIYGYPMMFEQIHFVLWVNHDLGWYDCIFYLWCCPTVPSVSRKHESSPL